MDSKRPTTALRVFFALVPDAATQHALGVVAREIATRAGGRAIVDANLHLTLAFIGDASPQRVGTLRAIVDRLPSRGFPLVLDRIGTFNRSELAWIAPTRSPIALAELQAALERALKEADFVLEDRPFHPHITLARRCARKIANPRVDAVEWNVERVALLASMPADGGVHYREVAGLALTADELP